MAEYAYNLATGQFRSGSTVALNNANEVKIPQSVVVQSFNPNRSASYSEQMAASSVFQAWRNSVMEQQAVANTKVPVTPDVTSGAGPAQTITPVSPQIPEVPPGYNGPALQQVTQYDQTPVGTDYVPNNAPSYVPGMTNQQFSSQFTTAQKGEMLSTLGFKDADPTRTTIDPALYNRYAAIANTDAYKVQAKEQWLDSPATNVTQDQVSMIKNVFGWTANTQGSSGWVPRNRDVIYYNSLVEAMPKQSPPAAASSPAQMTQPITPAQQSFSYDPANSITDPNAFMQQQQQSLRMLDGMGGVSQQGISSSLQSVSNPVSQSTTTVSPQQPELTFDSPNTIVTPINYDYGGAKMNALYQTPIGGSVNATDVLTAFGESGVELTGRMNTTYRIEYSRVNPNQVVLLRPDLTSGRYNNMGEAEIPIVMNGGNYQDIISAANIARNMNRLAAHESGMRIYASSKTTPVPFSGMTDKQYQDYTVGQLMGGDTAIKTLGAATTEQKTTIQPVTITPGGSTMTLLGTPDWSKGTPAGNVIGNPSISYNASPGAFSQMERPGGIPGVSNIGIGQAIVETFPQPLKILGDATGSQVIKDIAYQGNVVSSQVVNMAVNPGGSMEDLSSGFFAGSSNIINKVTGSPISEDKALQQGIDIKNSWKNTVQSGTEIAANVAIGRSELAAVQIATGVPQRNAATEFTTNITVPILTNPASTTLQVLEGVAFAGAFEMAGAVPLASRTLQSIPVIGGVASKVPIIGEATIGTATTLGFGGVMAGVAGYDIYTSPTPIATAGRITGTGGLMLAGGLMSPGVHGIVEIPGNIKTSSIEGLGRINNAIPEGMFEQSPVRLPTGTTSALEVTGDPSLIAFTKTRPNIFEDNYPDANKIVELSGVPQGNVVENLRFELPKQQTTAIVPVNYEFGTMRVIPKTSGEGVPATRIEMSPFYAYDETFGVATQVGVAFSKQGEGTIGMLGTPSKSAAGDSIINLAKISTNEPIMGEMQPFAITYEGELITTQMGHLSNGEIPILGIGKQKIPGQLIGQSTGGEYASIGTELYMQGGRLIPNNKAIGIPEVSEVYNVNVLKTENPLTAEELMVQDYNPKNLAVDNPNRVVVKTIPNVDIIPQKGNGLVGSWEWDEAMGSFIQVSKTPRGKSTERDVVTSLNMGLADIANLNKAAPGKGTEIPSRYGGQQSVISQGVTTNVEPIKLPKTNFEKELGLDRGVIEHAVAAVNEETGMFFVETTPPPLPIGASSKTKVAFDGFDLPRIVNINPAVFIPEDESGASGGPLALNQFNINRQDISNGVGVGVPVFEIPVISPTINTGINTNVITPPIPVTTIYPVGITSLDIKVDIGQVPVITPIVDIVPTPDIITPQIVKPIPDITIVPDIIKVPEQITPPVPVIEIPPVVIIPPIEDIITPPPEEDLVPPPPETYIFPKGKSAYPKEFGMIPNLGGGGGGGVGGIGSHGFGEYSPIGSLSTNTLLLPKGFF